MAEVLAITASIISIISLSSKVISLGYGYISGRKRTAKYLRNLEKELSSFSEVLGVFRDSDMESKALQILSDRQTELLVLCERDLKSLIVTLEPKGGIRGALGGIQWPPREQEIEQLVARIERHKILFMVALGIDQTYLFKNIKEYSKEIETSVKGIRVCVDGLEISAGRTEHAVYQLKATSEDQRLSTHRIEGHFKDAGVAMRNLKAEYQIFSKRMEDEIRIGEKRKVLNWIYPGEFDERHLDISSRRQENTGRWLVESETFLCWKQGLLRSRLLWGYGIPGAGKTFLSSMVIDYFQRKTQAPTINMGVAYIYFNYMEQNKQMPYLVLGSLIKQLAMQITELPVEILCLYHELECQGKRPSLEELYGAVLTTFKAFDKNYLIFDALDECNRIEKRGDLLRLFHRLGEESNVYLFLTSRDYPEDIRTSFGGAAHIKLKPHKNDIRSYIMGQIGKNERARRLIREGRCRERIITELIRCAQGMFLLVHFHIRYLCEQPTVRKLLIALENLWSSPNGEGPLDPTYDRAMETLRGQNKNCETLGLLILSWLVKARRPLIVDEIQMAVSVDPGQHELDKHNIPDRTTLVDVCAGLVAIDEATNIIRLVHYTVHEYLTGHQAIPEDANFRIAMTCITFLSFDVFAEGACGSEKALNTRRRAYPFIEYATQHLSVHLKGCSESLTAALVSRLLKKPGSISSYFQYSHYRENIFAKFNTYPRKRHPLHMAAILGHHAAALQLLKDGAEISAVDKDGQTALHMAVSKDESSMVQLLIEKGIDLSTRDRHGRTVLHLAASKGYDKILRILLEKGADPSAQDDSRRSALWWAIYGGREAAVRVLLENGVAHTPSFTNKTMETQNTEAGLIRRLSSTLANASHGFITSILNNPTVTHEDIVKLFPASLVPELHSAVARGNEGIVRLLIDFGADVLGLDEYNQTVLSKAVFGEHESMVRLLLEKGADPLAQNESGMTALHMAAFLKGSELTCILLAYGADLSIVDKSGSTALHVAASRGNEAVVQLLLVMGADPSVQDKDRNNSVFLAARSGHERLARILAKAFDSRITSIRTRSNTC